MNVRFSRVLGLVAVVTPFVIGLTAAGAGRDGQEVFRFTDSEIVESSGLVIEGDRAFTMNDSGDTGRVFTVDTATGDTVGVTFWADGPDDVEALAPGGPGYVWVGDIGDNAASRDSIEVTRVPVGEGDLTVEEETIDLVYPDGASDAEALLVHPVTGRLYVATKGIFGGELYAAPPELAADAPNMLGLIGETTGMVTDGAFFPDGEHLILRTYTGAVVYSFPDLEQVGYFDLPSQAQGEGIAATSDRSVFLSSEGQRAPVLKVSLPPDIRSQLSPTPTTATSPAAGRMYRQTLGVTRLYGNFRPTGPTDDTHVLKANTPVSSAALPCRNFPYTCVIHRLGQQVTNDGMAPQQRGDPRVVRRVCERQSGQVVEAEPAQVVVLLWRDAAGDDGDLAGTEGDVT